MLDSIEIFYIENTYKINPGNYDEQLLKILSKKNINEVALDEYLRKIK